MGLVARRHVDRHLAVHLAACLESVSRGIAHFGSHQSGDLGDRICGHVERVHDARGRLACTSRWHFLRTDL